MGKQLYYSEYILKTVCQGYVSALLLKGQLQWKNHPTFLLDKTIIKGFS